MEIIYRAIDGKEFDNEADCVYHEQTLGEYHMWDRMGRYVEDKNHTDKAFVLYLPKSLSARVFLEAAKACGDTGVNSLDADCRGLYLWDECSEEYRYIDADEHCALFAAFQFIEGGAK